MTRLAVTLAGDTDNPQGFPAEWPVRVEELSDDSVVIQAPRQEMTPLQYQQHCTAYQPLYDAWERARDLAAAKSAASAALWQSCHDYEYARFSGGIFAQILELKLAGVNKAVDIQNWLLTLWGDYYARKYQLSTAPDISSVEAVNFDFSSHAEPPWTVEQMLQDAAALMSH
jgi:hypothetical protein